KEVSALAADPPEGIKVYPSEEDITELHTAIEGPGEAEIQTWLLWQRQGKIGVMALGGENSGMKKENRHTVLIQWLIMNIKWNKLGL
uniref:Uncharacterized protein n=1 Tax=Cynoglossus semilaevis TaxID=244447 RepID=A0A3P8WX18_CYNSE